jgi:hypothetical protein
MRGDGLLVFVLTLASLLVSEFVRISEPQRAARTSKRSGQRHAAVGSCPVLVLTAPWMHATRVFLACWKLSGDHDNLQLRCFHSNQ